MYYILNAIYYRHARSVSSSVAGRVGHGVRMTDYVLHGYDKSMCKLHVSDRGVMLSLR